MEKKHYHVIVAGRVQGVFFRASAMDKARHLGLKGFVRNERNGNVYIEVEGDEAALKEYIEWCHIGPPAAKVERCDVVPGPVVDYKSFEIQR
jgi:acylphosphatase